MESITVLVAAPRRSTRAACLAALGGAPGVRVVAQPRTALQAIAAIRRLRPDVAVVACSPASRHLGLLLETLGAARRPRIVLVTPARTESVVLAALVRGARGHLAPGAVRQWLAGAVRAVARGEAWCSRALEPAIVARLVEAWGLEGPQTPTRSAAPRRSRGAPRDSERLLPQAKRPDRRPGSSIPEVLQ